MKKIYSIIAITTVTILIISSLTPILSASCIKSSDLTINSEEFASCMEVRKYILVDNEEFTNYETENGSIVRFRINITYHDVDGEAVGNEPNGYILKNIVITDILPKGLIYRNNATREADDISNDNRVIEWNLTDEVALTELEDSHPDTYTLEFDVEVSKEGTLKNKVEVNAIESCYDLPRYNESEAILTVTTTETYNLNIDITGQGTVTKYPDNYNYLQGEEVTLEAIENTGWVFDHWEGAEIDGSTDKTETITMNSDKNLKVYFIEIETPKYTLETNTVGQGIITKNPNKTEYFQGSEVVLTAIPKEGWVFECWSGDISGNENVKSITINENKTVTAHFKENGSIEKPTVEIKKPKKHISYFYNIPIGFRLRAKKTKIIGPITIKAKADSDVGIEKVEFYINGKLKHTDKNFPYRWTWWIKPIDLTDSYNVTVVAYDKEGNKNSDQITVHRERPKFLLSKIAIIGKIIFGDDWDINDDNFWDDIDKDKLKKFVLIAGGVLAAGSIIRLLRNRGDETEPEETDPDKTDPDDPDNKNANEKPVAKISGPYEGETDQKISFDASDSYDPNGDSMTYKWDFGDGNTAYGEKVTHIYKKPGKYTIKLTIEDTHGSTETEKRTIEIIDKDKSKEEDTTFWYIVTGLSTGLLATLGTLYFRRRYFV